MLKQRAQILSLGICLTALLGWTFRGNAQITVEVDFDKEQYLPFEPIILEVKITNFSGRTLRLGEDPDWLDILVERTDGRVVRQIAQPPVVYPFQVPNAARAIRRLNITPYFAMRDPAEYKVTVTVRIKELGLQLESKPGKFIVVPGTPFWEQTFGYQRKDKNGKPIGLPEIRRYALLQVPSGRRILLYVRVSNADGSFVYRIFPVGVFLTFSHPETQIDRQSNLHLLWQSGAREFTYIIVDPNGRLLRRKTYRYTHSRPHLWPGRQGEIRVVGGTPITTPYDIPPPKTNTVSSTTHTNTPPSKPSTNQPPPKPKTSSEKH